MNSISSAPKVGWLIEFFPKEIKSGFKKKNLALALALTSQFPSNSGLHLHYSPRKIHLSIFKDTKVYFYGEEVFFFVKKTKSGSAT